MTDTFCSFTRNVTFVTCFLLPKLGSKLWNSLLYCESVLQSPCVANDNNDNDNKSSYIYHVHISIQQMFKALHTLLLPLSFDRISRLHLQCTITTPEGAFLADLPIRVLQANICTHHVFRILYRVPIYTLASRAAMRINCLAEGPKCQEIVGIKPGGTQGESRVNTPYPKLQ